jgi:predicted RNA binding protein YcfA (HicA-like mRNA interferase family)
MSKPPILKPREIIHALEKLGFINTRSKGSHFFFRHRDGRTTVVPVHYHKTIGPGLMRAILSDIKISSDEFKKYL